MQLKGKKCKALNSFEYMSSYEKYATQITFLRLPLAAGRGDVTPVFGPVSR